MPLSSLVRLLQSSALTGELCERIQRPDRLLLRGGGRGARAHAPEARPRHGAAGLRLIPEHGAVDAAIRAHVQAVKRKLLMWMPSSRWM